MPCFQVFFATILFFPNPLHSIDSRSNIINTTNDIIETIEELWYLINDFSSTEADEYKRKKFISKIERKLFEKLGTIATKLDVISSETKDDVLTTLPEKAQLSELLTYKTAVDVEYKRMIEYTKHVETLERQTVEEFIESVVSQNNDSVRNLVEKIYDYIVPSSNELAHVGMTELIGNVSEEVDMICSTQKSSQQELYNLFNLIAFTQLKGFITVQCSYMLLKLYDKRNLHREASLMKSRYINRTNIAIQSMKKAMSMQSQELWMCDPQEHIEDETYVQITQLIQGYIQNEIDLNPEGTCHESCWEYTETKSNDCYGNEYCMKQRRCNGTIHECQNILFNMSICPSEEESGRRYEYVEYDNGRVLGEKKACESASVKLDVRWEWMFMNCAYCLCFCDQQDYGSNRYFNLRPTMANLSNNMVVTGLRFVKENHIIHLQIQEGKLLPQGTIDQSSASWIPVDNYLIENAYSQVDFHILTWKKRALDLDDLIADEGYLVTGVRFSVIKNHLNFQIFITPFDFESGNLIEPLMKSFWINNPNERKQLDISNPDIPTRSPLQSIPNYQHDRYIQFSYSDLDKDAAQTTIPFIDIQPIESVPPVPLSGVGVYHKGRDGFGGFIAPKIIPYNYSEHLNGIFDGESINGILDVYD